MKRIIAKMTEEEYKRLPKSSPINRYNLKEGRTYFIEAKYILYSSPSGDRDEDVTHNITLRGKFLRLVERPNYGGQKDIVRIHAEFEGTEIITDKWCDLKYNPYTPTLFDTDEKRGYSVFKEDHSPGVNDKLVKLFSLRELKKLVEEKKMEPEENPSICFIGEEYRAARDRFSSKL